MWESVSGCVLRLVLVSNAQQTRWIHSATARQREQSFERTPKWEELNSERLSLGHSTEESLKKSQKLGKRGK